MYEDAVRLEVITCKNPNGRVHFDYVAEQSYKIEWFSTSKAAIRFSLTSRSRWRRHQVGIGGVFLFLSSEASPRRLQLYPSEAQRILFNATLRCHDKIGCVHLVYPRSHRVVDRIISHFLRRKLLVNKLVVLI